MNVSSQRLTTGCSGRAAELEHWAAHSHKDIERRKQDIKSAYWIAILALLGGIVGYAGFRSTGWLGTGIGVVLGILVGTLLYSMQARKDK